jgi:two-component system chemotaxis response regulator CheB
MSAIRVLLVEDSLTVRTHLRGVLSRDPDLDIAGEAADGATAVRLCRQLRPDVITMDMMLPVESGLAATEQIMATCPTPILVVSSSTNRGEVLQTYQALAAGAVDVLDKPSGLEPEGVWERRLIAAVKLVSRIRVISHPRARFEALANRRRPRAAGVATPPVVRDRNWRYDAVGIGTSTGGPGALVHVLRALPSSYAIPVLLVLHIGEPFALAFAEWLTSRIGRKVSYARGGEKLSAIAGQVVMAPPDWHLIVRDGQLRLNQDAERHSCRPSVDVLFESLARECGPRAAACLLTGMGRDGASGLLELRTAGALTIAQDEATSVVYGMPREAALLGAAELVLPLEEIGSTVARLTATSDKATRT